jgi:hypothetical protein
MFSLEILMGSNPHPNEREKSLPVPIGITPKTTLLKSIFDYNAFCNTQGIVPSPPQTITRTSFLN